MKIRLLPIMLALLLSAVGAPARAGAEEAMQCDRATYTDWKGKQRLLRFCSKGPLQPGRHYRMILRLHGGSGAPSDALNGADECYRYLRSYPWMDNRPELEDLVFVCPQGTPTRLNYRTFGSPEAIDDYARIPKWFTRFAEREFGAIVDPEGLIAFGACTGGTDVALLVARHPGLVDVALIADAPMDWRWYIRQNRRSSDARARFFKTETRGVAGRRLAREPFGRKNLRALLRTRTRFVVYYTTRDPGSHLRQSGRLVRLLPPSRVRWCEGRWPHGGAGQRHLDAIFSDAGIILIDPVSVIGRENGITCGGSTF